MIERNKKRRQSSRDANSRYDSKTYKTILMKLRKDDDSDILKYIEEAKAEGKTNREWLRDLFAVYKK